MISKMESGYLKKVTQGNPKGNRSQVPDFKGIDFEERLLI